MTDKRLKAFKKLHKDEKYRNGVGKCGSVVKKNFYVFTCIIKYRKLFADSLK